MQLKVTKSKLCITGGRGSDQVISLFLDGVNCSNFHWFSLCNDVYNIQVHKNLFFSIQKIFEYVVIKHKDVNTFDYF